MIYIAFIGDFGRRLDKNGHRTAESAKMYAEAILATGEAKSYELVRMEGK